MLQVANAVQQYEPARNRAQKLEDFRGHMVRVMNGMLDQVSDASARLLPDALFILAGYSWRYDTWRIWTIRFDRRSGRFASHAAERWRGGHDRKVLAIVGDSVDSARSRLIELLRAEKHLSSGGFDWEPLRILVSMIGDGRFPSIGGPPKSSRSTSICGCSPSPSNGRAPTERSGLRSWDAHSSTTKCPTSQS
jgi:hypothetical protein